MALPHWLARDPQPRPRHDGAVHPQSLRRTRFRDQRLRGIDEPSADRVVVPRDAVAGIPADYATTIIDKMLSLLANLTTTDELIATWS
jgi:hypothetical protein